MKLHVGGYIRSGKRMKRLLCREAKDLAEELLRDHARIRRLRITFTKDDPNWDYGFSWLVNYDQVEIVVPSRFSNYEAIGWLLRHELRHAKQILEGRLNKNLQLVRFTNRRGLTRTFKPIPPTGTQRYAEYRCVETGKKCHNREPWEMEVNNDDRRAKRKTRRKAVS